MAYRGYSKSTGTPSFAGLKDDGESIFRFALQEQKLFRRDKVVIHGKSLGAGVVLHTLSHSALTKQIKGVVIENTFTSILDMANIIYPKLRMFTRLMLRNNWDNESYVKNLPKHLQVLFITGKRDEITPTRMIMALYEECPLEDKLLLELPRGMHNNTWFVHRNEYFKVVGEFVERLGRETHN